MERKEYIEKLKSQLDEWNVEFGKLESRFHEVQDKAKGEFNQQLEEIKARQVDLKSKINELEGASELALNDMKKSVESAWEVLKQGAAKAKNEFLGKDKE